MIRSARIVLALVLAAAGASAQQPPLAAGPIPQQPATTGPVLTLSATHDDWAVLCAGAGGACRAVQQRSAENGVPVLELVLQRAGEDLILTFGLPFGLDLPAGVAFQIDDGPESQLPITTCFASGCQATAVLDAPTLAALRAGTTLKVGMRAILGGQTVVVEASLAGSSKAIDALAP